MGVGMEGNEGVGRGVQKNGGREKINDPIGFPGAPELQSYEGLFVYFRKELGLLYCSYQRKKNHNT